MGKETLRLLRPQIRNETARTFAPSPLFWLQYRGGASTIRIFFGRREGGGALVSLPDIFSEFIRMSVWCFVGSCGVQLLMLM
ncbi:hypothetical protein ACH3XW_43250 [Acanthocheilonema viteae]